MEELAAKWQDLTDIQQASITELIAGKRQGNIISSLMANFETAQEVLETSANSAGSAMKEHEKYMDSIEARLNKLSATWQSLSQSFLSSNFLKTGISIITGFVNDIDKLIQKIGVLPTLLGAIGIVKLAKDLLLLKSEITSVSTLMKAFGAIFPNLSNVFTGFFSTLSAGQGVFAALKAAASGLWTVIAAHPILAAAAAVGVAIVACNHFTESASELAERIEDVTSKYREQHEELQKAKGDYDTTNADSMISRYGELSKGIDQYGENIALTADEYAEYQSIVNQIASQIPSLVSGYNSQGDAILDCAGSVAKLREEYENLIKEQNDEVLDTGEDIFKDFNNDIKKTSLYYQRSILDENGKYLKSEWEYSTDHLEQLEALLKKGEGAISISELSDAEVARISGLLDEYGIKRDVLGSGESGYETYREHVIRVLEEDKAKIKKVLEEASADLNAYAEDMGTVTEAFFSTAFLGGNGSDIGDYSGISEKMQNIITKATSGLGADFYADFLNKENPYEALTEYYNSLLETFENLNDTDTAKLEAAFDLKTQFNGGEISYGEYTNKLKEAEELIDSLGLGDEISESIKLSLNVDEVTENYENLKKRLTSEEFGIQMKTDEAERFLNGLSASEYAVAVDLIASGELDLSNFDIKSLRKYIEEQAELQEALNYTIAIDVETEGVESLNTALSESVSATGLSSESITALKSRYADLESEGYNLSAMFEETSNGIHLNREAVSKLEQAYASNKLSETNDKLETLKNRYDEVTKEIKNCTNASDRAALYTEQKTIVAKINDLATLAAQYKGLTSAYNEWQSAESAGSERDMYESIIEGFENIGDEISRGWYDDGTIEFLELLTGKTNLASKSGKELKEIWNGLDDTIGNSGYSIKDFFTTNDDGDSTNTGVYNFLRTVESFDNLKKAIKRDENGNIISFDFDVVGGDKAIAETLGISEELVQIMLRAADDAGFVINLEGAYTQLADLKTEAETARDTLISLQKDGLEKLKGVDVNFDLEAEGDDLLAEQEKAVKLLDKFKKDGKIDLTMEGAQEALDIAEYLTIKLDDLTEPKIMQIDTSEVDKDLRDPIEKMQEIVELSKQKNLVSLTGDTKEIEKVQDEIDKVAEELAELDPEIKAQVGIDENWTADEIADKIAKGEIEIPAELELDVQMSDDLKDIRLMMMKQLGLADDNEVKLKIGYDIDDSTVDKLIKDGKEEIVLEFITKNEKWFEKLSDDKKEIVIDLVASGVDLSTLDDEKKTVVVEYITDNKEWFDNLSDDRKEIVIDLVSSGVDLDSLDDEKKEVVIKYVEENKDLFDSLSDDEKTVVVKYIAEGKDFDKLTDEEKEVIVKLIGDDSELKDYTPEQKEAMVKYLVDGGDVEGWTPEQKQAWAKYLVDHGDIDGWTPEMKQAWAQYLVDGGDVEGWTPEMKEAYAKYIVDGGDVSGYTPEDKKALAKYLVDGGDPANYQPPSKTQNVKAKLDSSEPDDYQPENKSFTVKAILQKVGDWANSLLSGGSKRSVVNGTANANGTAFIDGTTGKAFKRGNWGIKDSGTALVGELGTETLVRDGHYYTIGDAGAEFINYKKGDIIFNHKQTEELFRYGKVTSGNGRGKALVGGTAFSSGTGGGEEYNPVTGQSYGSSPSSSSSSSSSDTDDDFEEVIDWIEVIIDRIERFIDKFEQKANNIYKSWSSRNTALQNQISEVGEEITLQQKAYNKYMEAADGVGLSSSYAEKVRNGTIDIETITDETLKEKIDEYTKWYNKALDTKDAIEELREEESKLYAQRFENVQSEYDGILQGYEHTETMLNEYINQAEAQGHIVSKKYYQALIANEKSNIAELKKEQSALIEARDEAVASGKIEKYSEEWYSMCAEIDSVTQAIEEGTTSLIEYNNAMRDIDWEIFDLIQERISDVTSEADFLIELMSNKKLFDDNGKLTSQGLATMGLHAQNYDTYMYQADEYANEIAKLDEQIASDPYDQDLIDRRNELLELQRESILAAEDEKNAIRDMVEEGINLELDSLQELIDKKNEALESERDLYEYQKKVSEQTKEIAKLEKEMSSYSQDDSEETRKKVQELKVSLEEAKADLQETEYDKYISDQQQLLDALYDEYELILNQRLDNIDYLLESVIETINATAGADGIISSALGSDGALSIAIGNNATSIKSTLETEAKNVGVTLSSAMNSIWSVGEGNAKSVLTMYGEDFKAKSTTINTTLNDIKASVNSMVSALNKEATTKTTANKTATSAKKNLASSSSSKKTTTTKKSTSSGDGTPKIGDRVKYVDGVYYYDSQGKKPLGSHNKGEYVYITNINKKSWATHPYHISTGNKLGKGDLGWLKLNQLSGYAVGKKDFLGDEYAWTQEDGKQEFIVRPSDGAILTPIAKGDSVLTSTASNNIWNMANSPAEFIKDNLNLGTTGVPNNSNVQNAISQNFENITFSLPNVKNYSELLSELQRDPKFEKLVLAMTVDQIAGKSSLAKGKVIR